MTDTITHTGGFIHLAEHHNSIVEDARLLHFAIKLLCLTASLSNTAEHADTFVLTRHVMDNLGDQNRLSNPGTTEESRLTATFQRA